jgi:hypothetical protein
MPAHFKESFLDNILAYSTTIVVGLVILLGTFLFAYYQTLYNVTDLKLDIVAAVLVAITPLLMRIEWSMINTTEK